MQSANYAVVLAMQAIIIGHSMGNLVTRYFLESMGGADVTLMHIAIAAPFQGAPSTLQQLLFGGTMLTYGMAWRTLNAGASLWLLRCVHSSRLPYTYI